MKINPNSFTLHVKTISFAVFASTIILMFGCNPSLPKGELSIKNDIKPLTSDADLASHKVFDVEVYKTLIPTVGTGYKVTYYQNEKGKLNNHSAMWGTEEDYDKAAYSWVNDSSVSIRLYNSKSQKEAKFKVSGYGSRSSMFTE